MTAKYWPVLRTAGVDGFLVSFGESLSDRANRAALAFREAVMKSEEIPLIESSTSLVSSYFRFDPERMPHADVRAKIEAHIAKQNWLEAKLPKGRKRWRIPTVFGGEFGPQLAEAASLAGLSKEEAIASLCARAVRVETIGFAPGMPYLGELAKVWDVPRQKTLSANVPKGGLCVAIRQLVLFPVATPTGWRHIGQTKLELFRPDEASPFLLRAGDEVLFEAVTPREFSRLSDEKLGGAEFEVIN